MSSAFRITQRSISESTLANLQANLSRFSRLQEQLSSGRALSRPSDSPTGTVSALRLRAQSRRSEQLVRNAQDGLGWLGTADNALTGGLSLLRRARELALSGGNAALGDEARAALAAEVDVLRDGLLAVANTTYLNRPIFAGTAAGDVAYDAGGAYRGDAGTVQRSVGAGVDVRVNLTGIEVFGAAGDDVFAVLADLAGHLRNDPAAVTTGDLERLDAAFLRMQNSLATVGARYHQVEIMQARTESNHLDDQSALSEVEGVDLPATVLELQLQEVAYQAALGATARAITPSLVDFLR